MGQYEYDSEGNTSLIFALAFVAVYLLVATYNRAFNWRRKDESISTHLPPEFVSLCRKKKRQLGSPKSTTFSLWNIIYVIAWLVLAVLVVSVQRTAVAPVEEFNPYQVLGLAEGADEKGIRSAYRKLSLQYHPDKNPDDPLANDKYIQIVKAHQTLTDPVTRENWEKYGHPDGKRAESFGVALPAWMVSNDYKWLVLAMYCVGLVGGSVIVFIWWERSRKMSDNHVRQDTLGLFYNYMRSTMNVNEVIDLLCVAAEFKDDIPQRVQESQTVAKYISAIKAKDNGLVRLFATSKLSADYCTKAKALVFSYLLNIDSELEDVHKDDLRAMLRVMPLLISAFIKMAVVKGRGNDRKKEKFYNLMPVLHALYAQQLLIQGLDATRMVPVLQVPLIDEDNFRFFVKGKRKITTIQQLMDMSETERRSMLRMLDDKAYAHMLLVAGQIPTVKVTATASVLTEDRVYTNALVTMKVRLERVSALERSQRPEEDAAAGKSEPETPTKATTNGKLRKRPGFRRGVKPVAKENDVEPEPVETKALSAGDEDVEWDEDLVKPKAVFTDRQHSSLVHCPWWPEEKEEAWWVFASDPTGSVHAMLQAEPVRVANLVDVAEVEIFVQPTAKPGRRQVAVWVVSDSYVGCETKEMVEFQVYAAPEPEVEVGRASGSEHSDSSGHSSDYSGGEESDVESDLD